MFGMLHQERDRSGFANTIQGSCSVSHFGRGNHSIFPSETVICTRNLFNTARFLGNIEISELLSCILSNCLFYFYTNHSRLFVRSFLPAIPDKTKRLFGKFVNMICKVSTRDCLKHIILGKPEVPRPHNGACSILHGDDSITTLDFVCRDMKIKVGISTIVGY